jgi:hypothetical protein
MKKLAPQRKNTLGTLAMFFAAALLFANLVTAQEPPKAAASTTGAKDAGAAAAEELQKAVQNPVASLISVPVQNNSNFSVGPYNRTQDVLNIQPVIPANISDNWMIISRIIQPIVWQPYPNQTTGGSTASAT